MTAEGAPRVERNGDVVTLTMCRPAKRNALSRDHLTELLAAVTEVGQSDAAGLVIAAEGPVFSAGHDFADVAGRPVTEVRSLLQLCSELMQTLHDVPQVVLARVHALATAAGCQLVASCDLAVAAESATFAVSGINVGLFCSTPAVALSRNVSPKHAFDMLVTGRFISSAEALSFGLVNRVAPDAELDEAVGALTADICAKSPVAIRTGKAMFGRQRSMGLEEAYSYAGNVMACNMMAEDAAEGIDAFIGKRKPVWKGR